MPNFSTIRLTVRGASQKNLTGGGIHPPARAIDRDIHIQLRDIRQLCLSEVWTFVYTRGSIICPFYAEIKLLCFAFRLILEFFFQTINKDTRGHGNVLPFEFNEHNYYSLFYFKRQSTPSSLQ